LRQTPAGLLVASIWRLSNLYLTFSCGAETPHWPGPWFSRKSFSALSQQPFGHGRDCSDNNFPTDFPLYIMVFTPAIKQRPGGFPWHMADNYQGDLRCPQRRPGVREGRVDSFLPWIAAGEWPALGFR